VPEEKPILDYASNRRVWREIDLPFWLTLGIMVVLLLLDISCLAFIDYD
jgi:hypothetical protein